MELYWVRIILKVVDEGLMMHRALCLKVTCKLLNFCTVTMVEQLELKLGRVGPKSDPTRIKFIGLWL